MLDEVVRGGRTVEILAAARVSGRADDGRRTRAKRRKEVQEQVDVRALPALLSKRRQGRRERRGAWVIVKGAELRGKGVVHGPARVKSCRHSRAAFLARRPPSSAAAVGRPPARRSEDLERAVLERLGAEAGLGPPAGDDGEHGVSEGMQRGKEDGRATHPSASTPGPRIHTSPWTSSAPSSTCSSSTPVSLTSTLTAGGPVCATPSCGSSSSCGTTVGAFSEYARDV